MNQFYYTTCFPVYLGCQLWTDSGMNVLAADGYYSNGTEVLHVLGGIVVEIDSCQVTPTPTPTNTVTATNTPTPTPTPTPTRNPISGMSFVMILD